MTPIKGREFLNQGSGLATYVAFMCVLSGFWKLITARNLAPEP